MKVEPRDAERFTARPPDKLIAVLVFGPDQGLVRERAERFVRHIVPDLNDPFRVSEIAEDTLLADPARLADEAAAISMVGGRRVVRVRDAGNSSAELFARFLDEPISEALLVVEAGDLTKSAALRKVFENTDMAAAVPCYLDSDRTLDDVVRSAMKEAGLDIEPAALAEAVSRLGSDRGVTRRELEKLALYAQGEKTVTIAHVQAVMGDESELRMDKVCDAAGEGDTVRLDRELTRLWESGTSAVAVIRVALGHFQRVLLFRAKADEGAPPSKLIDDAKPPIFFQRKDSFRNQLTRWNVEQLEQALQILYDAELLCKTTGMPNEAVTGRALFNVAALARTR